MRKVCHYLILLIVIFSCTIDHGLSPTTQGISGTVTFEGQWADSIAEARVVVLSNYPAATVLDLAGYSESIAPGTSSYDYTIELSPATYPFVGVVCRSGTNWDVSSLQCILGFYGGSQPDSVEVKPGQYTHPIDITVKFTE